MTTKIMTTVTAAVPAEQEAALLDGFRALLGQQAPEGLVRSDLLRAQDGTWVVQTLWQDMAAIMRLRAAGEPPAARRLFEGLGAEATHDVLTVVQGHSA